MDSNIKHSSSSVHAGATLTIDLRSIAANYQILLKKLGGVEAGAVVKANAYGLGVKEISSTLVNEGCKTFFVASIDEGVELRQFLPHPEICILNGLNPSSKIIFKKYNLIPVLNSLSEIKEWKDFCNGISLPCCIHVDTGMHRLGLSESELKKIKEKPEVIKNLKILYVMSHLASADDPNSQLNHGQLLKFKKIRKILPMGKASFAASSGIFLNKNFHFDIARPGIAIYGVNPTPNEKNPMFPVITLKARIVQVRIAKKNETVGYGGTYRTTNKTRIATVAIGYADGFSRFLSNNTFGYIENKKVPLIGRISMDLITFNVTSIPENVSLIGQWIELIGKHHTVDQIANEVGTIGHEILTSLGQRFHRVYSEN